MDEKKIFAGFGAVAVILLLIAVFSSRDSGPDLGDLIAAEVAPISDAVSDLGSRVEGLEGSLGALSEQLAEAATAEEVAAVTAQVDEALAQTGALSGTIEGLETALAETAQAVEAAVAAPAPAAAALETVTDPEDTTGGTAAEADTPAQDKAPASAAQADTSAPADTLSPGQTALFADGALRLFISRLDPEGQAVRVSVMGETKSLTVGQGRTLPVGDDFCRVTVQSVSDEGAIVQSICGDDLPAPEGISVGTTALLADGALRVFASRVLEDEARLSINGETHSLPVGRSVPVMAGEESCRVYLDAVDRGHASVSATCGEAVAVSDLAGPGSTVLLDDGAVRVFVGAVMEDQVRFSVNGQTLVSGGSGDRHTVSEGCAVTVEDITEDGANFSYACEG